MPKELFQSDALLSFRTPNRNSGTNRSPASLPYDATGCTRMHRLDTIEAFAIRSSVKGTCWSRGSSRSQYNLDKGDEPGSPRSLVHAAK